MKLKTVQSIRKFSVQVFMILVVTFGLSCAQEGQPPGSDIPQSQIDQIIRDAERGSYGEIHSLIIYQKGELITEKYFSGFPQDSVHYQYSVSKSIASLLVGIAIDLGHIQSVDQSIFDFFPQYEGQIENWDTRKSAITLKDVLTMSAGFQWDEWTYIYTDTRNDANRMIRSSEVMKFVLDLPMAISPGRRFTYNSGCSMLLSGVIEQATGMTTEEFAQEYLFSKLGISEWYWEQSQDQKYNTGWGLHLMPMDMLKIGRLVLNNGLYEGEQIVSPEWLESSSTNHINNYGYQWWLSSDYFSARGWGGQVIAIAPERELLVVTTAGNFSGGGSPGLRIMNQLLN